MFKLKLFSLLALGSLLALTVVSFAATSVFGRYVRNGDGTIEYSGQKTIFLDTNASNNLSESRLNLSDFNVDPPAECQKADIACEQITQITVTTKKVWTPIQLSSIMSATLKPEVFAKYFPNLPADKTITNGSPLKTKLIAQRIFYERGLLPVLPTGRLGYLTELATMKLQCLKGFSEYDSTKAIFYAGPKTISALNTLKENLRDPGYLAAHPLPAVDLSRCGVDFQIREENIATALKTLTPKNTATGTPASTANKSIPLLKPNFLKLEGEVVIQKQ